jgi:Tol biopolymer transport system component
MKPNMQLCMVSLSGLVAGTALAACPYAQMPSSDVAPRAFSPHARAAEDKLGVMFMNRIAPSSSVLYVANADGSNERQLLDNGSSVFEYHASFSPDGQWITFTSERAGDGQSDIYRARINGSDLEELVATPAFEDVSVLSPDGTTLAYVSTEGNYTTNIWVKNLDTKEAFNLTDTTSTAGNNASPNGYFRPSWSPNGKWITFSSDRNTNWTGHSNGTGWEHTQTLSVYIIRPNGSDFQRVVSKEGYSLGSPKWSPDGSRILFYEMARDDTYNARTTSSVNGAVCQIASVDVKTGTDYIYHTSGDGCKISGQWVTADVIGYDIKGSDGEGLNYTTSSSIYSAVSGSMRSPSWSPDGSLVVYERPVFEIRAMEKPLYSWDSEWEYRFADVFPTLSKQGVFSMTQKQLGNSSIVTLNPDGTDLKLVFDTFSTDQIDYTLNGEGLAGAFQPTWSPDGEWIAFGLGSWFFERYDLGGWLYRATANGSYYEQLTFGTPGVVNSGFPSFSPDGTQLVYRDFGPEWGLGLRILNLTDVTVTNLTDTWDNTPGWSPDGERIVFTRRNYIDVEDLSATDSFDVYTIFPNGTGLTQLTTSGANDAHAVWAADGRIMWNSGMAGFKDEAPIYDNTFQPYGQIMIMNVDGSNKTMLTDSMWEDSMPLYVYNKDLE